MISSEVQRTLVKSPPELWAELGDPDALARHLGELGEITITRIEPEKTVEWEAADTTGKVLLKASAWGTKVTLTVTREVVAPEPPAEPEPAMIETADESVPPDPDPSAQEKPEPEAAEPEAAKPTPAEPTAAEPNAAEPEAAEPEAAEPTPAEPTAAEPTAESPPEPEPRRGFFARLFGRRKEQASSQPAGEREAVLASDSPTTAAITEPESIPAEETPPQDTQPQDIPDIASELKSAEEAATEEVTAVLTAALDRLGAAHHRPFSRA